MSNTETEVIAPVRKYTPKPDADADKVLAHLAETDSDILVAQSVIDELRTLADERERELSRRKAQRVAFIAMFCEDGPNNVGHMHL